MKRFWPRVLGWGMSALLLGGILWIVPFAEVGRALRQADHVLLLAALVPALVNLLLRGPRWALLFRPRHEVTARAALGPSLVGLALNAVLPGKVGEVSRIALGARRFGISLPFVTSTVVAERLLDALVLLTFLGGSLWTLPVPAEPATAELFGVTLSSTQLTEMARRIGGLCALLFTLVLALTWPASGAWFSRRLQGLPRIGPRVAGLFDETRAGLAALRHPRLLLSALAWSLGIWLALATSVWLVAAAMPGISLDPRQALAVTAISIVASSLPSAPGAWGVFEVGTLLALALVGEIVTPGVGVAFALVAHLCQYLPVVICGALAGARMGSVKA